MADLNTSVVTGRLGRDPESRYTNTQKLVVSFSLACNGYKKDSVDWLDCIAWEKTGEIIAKYCKKGDQLTIRGRLNQQTWKDKDGGNRSKIVIVADHIQLMGAKPEMKNQDNPGASTYDGPELSDDDIPF